MNSSTTPRSEWAILFGLFLAAFAIRLIGINHGVVLGDERINEAAKVLTGQLVPDQHFYPPLMNYLTAVLYGALYAVGKVTGVWADSAAFRAQYFQDPTIFVVTGRALVGFIGALMTPISYRIARLLNLTRTEALVVAIFAALAPISVYLSYIYKGDVPLATATLWTVLLLIRKYQTPNLKRVDIALGIAMTLALSFKHSFIFLMAPLFVAYVAVMLPHLGAKGLLASIGRIFFTGLVLWPILNIGIVLDFETFLAFQKIQAVMSITEGATLYDALTLLGQRMIHWQSGLGFVMPLAFLAFPLLAPRFNQPLNLIVIWLAVVAGMILVAYLVRLRQPEHLWVSFFVVVQLFGALALIQLTRFIKPLGVMATAAALALAQIGSIGVWQETVARPIAVDIAEHLKTHFPDRKAVTGIPLPIQQSRPAQDFEFARVEATAAKYEVILPERAAERRVPENNPEAYFILPLPNPMSGLENASDEDLKGNIQAYAWPPQQEDWTLDAWLAEGVELFVVSNLPYLQRETSSTMLRAFYQDLGARCAITAQFAPRKPLFIERHTVILDCKDA
ncbi:phospholipid carrier-dependent glycosyltransferase [Cognatishimia sp. 1_MG-2023]|uniref:glycosyltransferase family 39 protein n=1 Tax=Cognatishimia sp. 1_MG-2023 TaxID=3062642 RepID=UPI0026E1C6AE|nr:phospholipid carrier-dependent glycosyltransferase [Cognatishimia sp. 1_MG-2023]MDO6725743.1 phospholipid carrier-dependent glycosyltransferase [Cognatishimia sp. 1_MG-2023]